MIKDLSFSVDQLLNEINAYKNSFVFSINQTDLLGEQLNIYNLIEIGKNGIQTTLTVNSFKTNEPLSKTLFTFDESKYKDYYINKLD